MRPKRIIALIDPNDQMRSECAYVLRVHAHDVRAFPSPTEAARTPIHPDLVIACWPASEQEASLIAKASGCPLLYCLTDSSHSAQIADRCFREDLLSMEDLLQTIRILCTKRRGPKKTVAAVSPAVRQVA